MYINRALLFTLGALLIFFPAIESWVVSSETAWHRPYQLWALIVIVAYWHQHSRYPDEL